MGWLDRKGTVLNGVSIMGCMPSTTEEQCSDYEMGHAGGGHHGTEMITSYVRVDSG